MQLADLVGGLLQPDPGRRTTAAAALQHPFLAPVHPLQWLQRPSNSEAAAAAKRGAAAATEAAGKLRARAAAAQLPDAAATGHVTELTRAQSQGAQPDAVLQVGRLPDPGLLAMRGGGASLVSPSAGLFGMEGPETLNPPPRLPPAILDAAQGRPGSQGIAAPQTLAAHVAEPMEETAALDSETGRPSGRPPSSRGAARVAAVVAAAAAAAPFMEAEAAGDVEAAPSLAEASGSPQPAVSGAWEE